MPSGDNGRARVGGCRLAGGSACAASSAPQEFLKTVSENTGGFAITDTNAPAPLIQQLLRENASYYLLGYTPSNTRAQGRYRRIEVRANRPGVTVRTRHGYFEATQATTKKPAVSGADTPGAGLGILPKTDLPMVLTVAPFALPGQRNAALAIVVRMEQPGPTLAGQINEDVDVRVAAYAPTGDRRAHVNRVFPVSIKTSGRGATLRIDLPLRLDLPPGGYHLRVSARLKPRNGEVDNPTTGLEGSVYTDVDVPDFTKAPITLSGVVLMTSRSSGLASLETLASVLPAMPTTTREFGRDDQVTSFLRVYLGGDRPVLPVAVAIRVIDVTGASAFESSRTLDEESFGRSRAADVRFELPVSELGPGPYLLRVEASAGQVGARREVRFVVRSQ